MAGNKTEQDKIQDMRDGWVDGSCSELFNDIFGKLLGLWIVISTIQALLKS